MQVLRTSSGRGIIIIMPKQITEIRDFLAKTHRKDAKCMFNSCSERAR
jgi:hypothetical protein